ncbi:MAG TPA: rhodanese-like domain-containing protein [Hyphomicrobiales bacterium]|nr:rhodanese-like domain-containing protein [Hyphomicrobiales bacterium]
MIKPSIIVATLLVFGVLAPASSFADDAAQAVDNISPVPQQQLLDYLAGKSELTLVDARSTAEYDAGHIYGAVSVPLDTSADALTAALPEDLSSPLLVYCKTGIRAMQLQQRLTAAGYTDVRVLGPTQMLWADALPMFNCGVPDAPTTQLNTIESNTKNGG